MKAKTRAWGISIMVIIAMIFPSISAQAQDGPPQHRPMLPDSAQVVDMTNQMSKALSLTDAQKTKILNLQLAHFNQIKGIIKKDKAQHEQSRNKIHALFEEMHQQMRSVLTDKQQKQFKQFMESHHPPREEGPKPQRP